jgi:hypothetical protein
MDRSDLPGFGLLSQSGPLGFVFISEQGKKIILPASPPVHFEDRPPRGFELAAGEDRLMLFDISVFNAELEPGRYRLCVTYEDGAHKSEASPVQIQLLVPPAAVREEADRLRRENDEEEPSWVHFIRSNWRTVRDGELSEQTRDALALHLFLHRAIYRPAKVGDLELNRLDTFAKGFLESEAAVLRLEILTARGELSRAAATQTDILKKWPGLKWRVHGISRGAGLLTLWRNAYGAEQTFPTPPTFFPYTEKE